MIHMLPDVNKPGANSFNPNRHATRRYRTQSGKDRCFASMMAAFREEFSFWSELAWRWLDHSEKRTLFRMKRTLFWQNKPGQAACSRFWLAEIYTGVTKRKRATPQGISQWRQNLHSGSLRKRKQHSLGISNSRTAFNKCNCGRVKFWFSQTWTFLPMRRASLKSESFCH